MDRVWLCGLAALVCVGCTSDLGDGPDGHAVKGEVTYAGERAREFDTPVLFVTAETNLEQAGEGAPPYALVTEVDPDLDAAIPYELNFLLPGNYYIVAVIGELEDFQSSGSPLGAYPDNCLISEMPEARSVQMADEDLSDIDITVYDALNADPCFGGSGGDGGVPEDEGGMPEGTGTLQAEITAPGLMPDPGDTLTVTLFEESPVAGGEPAYTETVTDPSFPATVDVEQVAAGGYTIIVCFQAEDSPSEQCMGPDDRLAFHPSLSEMVAVEAAQTTNIMVELP